MHEIGRRAIEAHHVDRQSEVAFDLAFERQHGTVQGRCRPAGRDEIKAPRRP